MSSFGLVENVKFLLRNCPGLTMTSRASETDECALFAAIEAQRWLLLKTLKDTEELAPQILIDLENKPILDLLLSKIMTDDIEFFKGFSSRKDKLNYPEVTVIASSFLRKNAGLK